MSYAKSREKKPEPRFSAGLPRLTIEKLYDRRDRESIVIPTRRFDARVTWIFARPARIALARDMSGAFKSLVSAFIYLSFPFLFLFSF